ncbi:Uncharacterized protein (Fragment) OS=uncultured bacterium PE=4 SV=1 [Gemmataceae bacterium]
MTEQDWLACDDPEAMLEFVRNRGGSNRRLRLWTAAARFGTAAALGPLDHMMRALLESVADECLSAPEIDRVKADCWAYFNERALSIADPIVVGIYRSELQAQLELANSQDAYHCAAWAVLRLTNQFEAATSESQPLPHYFRDIFGNPFRPVAFFPEWRTSAAVAVAGGMYESRNFDAMPILADALQDAGCDSDDVLEHCRGPGPHVRGCWVVDLVLEKA